MRVRDQKKAPKNVPAHTKKKKVLNAVINNATHHTIPASHRVYDGYLHYLTYTYEVQQPVFKFYDGIYIYIFKVSTWSPRGIYIHINILYNTN